MKASRGTKALKDWNNWKKLWIPILGFASLLWFLIRVMPKPSRAAYPCQQAAFPIASAFVLWVAGLIPAALLIRKAKRNLHQARYLPGLAFILLAVISSVTIRFTVSGSDISIKAGSIAEQFIPSDDPNSPIGTARGIFPGRVAWVHDPDATSWDEVNGHFFDDENTSQTVVSNMVSQAMDGYTGATSNWDAWDALFKNFNERKGKGSVDYQEGEKIAIKINLNVSSTHGEITHLRTIASPQLILAVLTQLVENARVPDSCIIVYDNSRLIPAMIYDRCIEAYPGLRFIDKTGGEGREMFKTDSSAVMEWSEDLVLEQGGGNPTFLPECVSKADYLINIGVLKGHTLTGITLCAKNHVGTIISSNPEEPKLSPPRAAGFHAYAAVHDFEAPTWGVAGREMGTYNTLVDLMGHKYLGENTMLFIIDGLYASKLQQANESKPNHWVSEPFNNDWTSSIFISQDNVAIESVCLDFLRSEPTQIYVYGTVDNYLHEAALAHDPPSGTYYDPEGDGTRLGSLGVHEHWNNASDKQYSRNLGTGEGIELLPLGTKYIGKLRLSVPPGTYEDSVVVDIQSDVEDVNIHYTLDGSSPDQSSSVYAGGITISDNSVLNAIAYKDGYDPSSMVSGWYIMRE